MKEIEVIFHPYTTQLAKIKIPDKISEENLEEYIMNHINDMSMSEPDMDYVGTDFEIIK